MLHIRFIVIVSITIWIFLLIYFKIDLWQKWLLTLAVFISIICMIEFKF